MISVIKKIKWQRVWSWSNDVIVIGLVLLAYVTLLMVLFSSVLVISHVHLM